MKAAAPGRRPYRMTARAEATAATADRILAAAEAVFWERPTDRLSLDEVAGRAGVTVQTVIRRFGGKDGLLRAAATRADTRIRRQRQAAPVGDVPGAVRNLLDHYEEMGTRVLKLLAEEERVPGLRELVETGRRQHREWVQRTFAPSLAGLRGATRRRRTAQLVAVCDVYTWKLLRLDAGLSRPQVEAALVELIEGVAP